MEVVGAASAIITVIQITASLVSVCYDYQSGTRHYPKDIITITNELQSLRNVLERLVGMTNSQDDTDSIALPVLDSLNSPGGPLEICKIELKQLLLELAPAGGRLKQVRQALMWPLLEKDVQKKLSILARQRGLFQLALTADQTTMTLAIKKATSRNEESLIDLIQKFHAMALEQRRNQIFQWLAAPDPSSNHIKACQTKQRETGRWFIESLNCINWKKQRASFLWLHGIPGCGKTVLCSTVIEDIASLCQAGGRNILAYYYFDFNESKKQTCEGFLRSLVTQLFAQCYEGSKTMETLFTDCGEGRSEPTCKSLVQALRELSENFEEVYLILDALDECAETRAAISLIEEIYGWHNPSLHILVTSREGVIIEKGFRHLITDQVHIQNVLVDADIRLFVRECLCSDPELSQWSQSIKAEIEKTLYEGSKGMFRWAVCQLDTLRKCIKPSALRKALASLPKTLDDTYERILCNIDQDHAEDALKVLQWLAFSARPLGAQEVAEATAITLDDSPTFDPRDRLRHPTDILGICSSLISVSSRPISLPFEPPLRESSPLQSTPAELMAKSEDDCSNHSRPENHTRLCLDETCNITPHVPNSESVVDDISSTDSRLDTEPSDGKGHTPSPDLTEDHPRHYEVRLAHDSVKEYLVSERIKGTNAAFYSISEASSNVFLAKSCLAYLLHFKEPLNDSTALYLSEYPLLRYSAQEWEFHIIRSRDLSHDHQMNSVLKEFFLTQNFSFANWLDGPFGPYYGNFQQIEERVDDGGDLRLEGRLYHASRLGLLDVCKLLLEQGVSVDPPNNSTTGLVRSLSTPFQIAAHQGNEAVVRLLLDHGANVNQRSVHGSTLDYAVVEGRETIVRLLLENGAEVTVEAATPYYGLQGLTTLVLAARVGHAGIMKLVLDKGTYPRPRESYSEAYQEAMAQGHQAVADLLLEYWADLNHLTSNNDTDIDESDVEHFDVDIYFDI